jgi:ligand-binding SRPBCC domain-containing protein
VVRLEELTYIQAPIEKCFDLARSVEVHLAGNVHWGESALATGGVTSGLIGLGQRVTWRARHLGVRQNLTSEITAFEPPFYFRDTMIDGAFRVMWHDHFFRAMSADTTAMPATEMKDILCFAAPLPLLSRLAEMIVLRRYMRALLLERNAVLKRIAEQS